MIFGQILDYRHRMLPVVRDEYPVNRRAQYIHDTQAVQNMDRCRLHPENRYRITALH